MGSFTKSGTEQQYVTARNKGLFPVQKKYFDLVIPPKIVEYGLDEKKRVVPSDRQYKKINDIKYVELIYCWAAPLPCTQHELKGIKFRKPEIGLSGGFIRE
jgi:hypothetical protein